mmetsp:Transcript_44739/g.85543  ORF Transcript_44739/g.85543 Transcript_44739/m.85543 type:complete len:189 (-) Transcript_44739:314-880(-)
MDTRAPTKQAVTVIMDAGSSATWQYGAAGGAAGAACANTVWCCSAVTGVYCLAEEPSSCQTVTLSFAPSTSRCQLGSPAEAEHCSPAPRFVTESWERVRAAKIEGPGSKPPRLACPLNRPLAARAPRDGCSLPLLSGSAKVSATGFDPPTQPISVDLEKIPQCSRYSTRRQVAKSACFLRLPEFSLGG